MAGRRHGDGLRLILSDDGSVVGTVFLGCRLVSKYYLVCSGNNGRFGVETCGWRERRVGMKDLDTYTHHAALDARCSL